MAFVTFDHHDRPPAGAYLDHAVRHSVKLLVVGGFGVGKTTLIGSVSEIKPLRTEETMTAASTSVDDVAGLGAKTTTTVALDFGRITVAHDTVLYLFGAPGQRRFWDLWAGLAEGAAGALVLVDTRRLHTTFDVLDQLEDATTLPFIVAVNQFPDTGDHDPKQIRKALDLPPSTPLINCDARDRTSSARALITLVQHSLTLPKAPA